jgi:polyhydroxyalkanoate synthase
METGLRVFLVEWMPASKETGNNGLAEYVAAIRSSAAKVRAESVGARPFVMGHSLGGTLAAVFGVLAPAELQALVLLGAPLCFGPGTSRFRDALVKFVPWGLDDTEPCPGSVLSYASAMASPDAFIWSRFKDAIVNFAHPYALEMHALVERWALDEVPLPSKLVHQIVDLFYRKNLFCTGHLNIRGATVTPKSLSSPVLAVVNTADEVAPLTSVLPFVRAIHTKDTRIIKYSGEMGVGLQHLAFLIGRKAHAELWPEILSWIDARRQARTT